MLGNSGNNTDFVESRIIATTGYSAVTLDHSTGNQTTQNTGTNVCTDPPLWHMVAHKARMVNSTTANVGISLNGANFVTATGSSYAALTWSFNRIAIGSNVAGNSGGSEFKGDITAVFVYKDDYDTWTNTWISELYANPWQFLNTDGHLKLSVAPASNPGTKIYMTWET